MATKEPESTPKAEGRIAPKSASVTVRLEPKMRYLLELAARKQRRTVANYIETLVEQSFNAIPIHRGDVWNLAFAANKLWDVDESERLVKLAIHQPDLLNYPEQIIWNALLDSGFLDAAMMFSRNGRAQSWDLGVLHSRIFPALRQEWENLQQHLSDGLSQKWIDNTRAAIEEGLVLPKVEVERTSNSVEYIDDTYDDELPF